MPAVNGGATSAQFFTGLKTKFCDIYPLRNDRDFINVLSEVIRKRGAMDKLISDRSQVEISHKIKDLLRHLFIDDWQSESHYQHQNFSERRFQDVKYNTNKVLNLSGPPSNTWLLCMKYV